MLTDPFAQIVLNLPGWGNMHMSWLFNGYQSKFQICWKKIKLWWFLNFFQLQTVLQANLLMRPSILGASKLLNTVYFSFEKTLCFLVDLPRRWTMGLSIKWLTVGTSFRISTPKSRGPWWATRSQTTGEKSWALGPCFLGRWKPQFPLPATRSRHRRAQQIFAVERTHE